LSVLAATIVGTFLAIVGPPVIQLVARYAGQTEPVAFHPISARSDAAAPSTRVAMAASPATTAPDADPVPTPQPIEAPGRVQTDATPTKSFTTVGIRLRSLPSAGDPVQVRVRSNGAWSRWYPLDVNGDEGPDATSAEAAHSKGIVSEPLWIGSADAYQVNAPASVVGGQATMVLVRQVGTDVVVHDAATPAGAISPNAPAIHSRAEWGARAPTSAPVSASSLKLAILHHSVTANDYTPAQVPGIIRSIQAFHMDGNGWSDIGYNFVVDKYGGMWEARAGSEDSLVIGAHAAGFNTGSMGVVSLGNFDQVGPTAPQINSLAELVSWRFANYGIDPHGTVAYTSNGSNKYPAGVTVTLPTIIGHRNVGQTECPGQNLYNALPLVRAITAQKIPGKSVPIGVVDSVNPGLHAMRVSGWAIDPNTDDPISVHVYVDGALVEGLTASNPRPDLVGIFPVNGPNHGFSGVIPASPGPHQVCVFAINVGAGYNTLINCRQVVLPTGPPFGAVDVLTGGPDHVLWVSGWAIDPDGDTPTPVRISLDGVVVSNAPATNARPDVAWYFPGFSAAHGFSYSRSGVAPGQHLVCVTAVNSVGGGGDTVLRCANVVIPSGPPFGVVDAATAGPDGTIGASGWTIDPDTVASTTVRVSVDGVVRASLVASNPRPDVARVFPGYGSAHGYSWVSSGFGGGLHQVCVTAINKAGPGADTLLSCRQVTTPTGSPFGVLDVATGTPAGHITAAGWMIDPDTVSPAGVHLYVDGHLITGTVASASRPDVGAAFPAYGPLHGYSFDVAGFAPGSHTACVFGIDVAGGNGNSLVACRNVAV
jgi:hypothetical protein